MELLDQLEIRIIELLTQLEELQRENTRLRENMNGELESVNRKNNLLTQELEQEKQRNNTALERIETIMNKLKERLGNE